MSATLGLLVERYTKELYISHGKYRSRLNDAVAAVCEINPGRGGIAPRNSYHEAGKNHEQANQARGLMSRYCHVHRWFSGVKFAEVAGGSVVAQSAAKTM